MTRPRGCGTGAAAPRWRCSSATPTRSRPARAARTGRSRRPPPARRRRGGAAGAVSPGGALLATAGGRTARLWGGRSGAPLAGVEGHTGRVIAWAFSPDGAILATAARYPDHTVRLWDVRSGAALAVLKGH